MTTRRKTIGIVGAAAASVAFPEITRARGPGSDPRQALDHVVVLMFENRSFDNLLGRLYAPGEVKAFDGVAGKELGNPIPEWAEHGAERKFVPYGVSSTMNTPQPDPGEEYPHINTDLFGTLDPKNRFMPLARMVAPYNAPGDPRRQPTMDGFVMDYISAFTAEMRRQPSYDEYAQIMTGYTPQQMPVLSALARGFAVFDHWFCEVPSQTFSNRSFFHAATASGYVVNMSPPDSFPVHNKAETLFERLESKRLTWRVYCDSPSPASFTGIIHASRLRNRFATNFSTVADFLEDARRGRLPTYSFIEPNLWHGHNDMHPPIAALLHGLPYDPPSSLLGGDALLASVYDAVRTSSSSGGSNYLNTFLMVAFDESGGTYDHVPPPPAVPPTRSAPAGQMGFRFDRSGARVPAIAISAWIPERTVVNDAYRHTSMIQTLRRRWSLGRPLSARDASARDIAPVLSLGKPRAPDQWPEFAPRPVPKFDLALLPPDLPLSALGKALVHGMLAFEKALGAKVPTLSPDARLTGAQAIEMLRDDAFKLFPGLRT
ncbi:alkaline phosphatase family protein [Variovorax saccharolyticus]|uniref:alkaline phosphatase family protein n=1 Tax=Variovorax saccharolyticus TaxID=3053516 RepID=UPI002574F23E|nr:alkaline phosphatase family protein [Variovorax sp. J31P216]MDM0025469.1 alkaline phosphatase family protein [Variovorax sp. J31P216]